MSPDVENYCRLNCDVSKMRQADKPDGIHNCSNSQVQEHVMGTIGGYTWMQNMHYDLTWFNLFWITMDINTEFLIGLKEKEITFLPDLYMNKKYSMFKIFT